MAIQIVERQRSNDEELVFPSPRDKVVLSDMALTSLLRKIKPPSDVQGRIATAHGFRSSFRDWCSERGYPRDLAERALAHTVSNKVEAAYHRTDLLDQRRPLMQAWADYCSSQIKTKLAGGNDSVQSETDARPACIGQGDAVRIAESSIVETGTLADLAKLIPKDAFRR